MITKTLQKLDIIKYFLPKKLFARFLLMILMPIILLQVITAYVFYERHWEKVSTNMLQAFLIDEIHWLAQNIESMQSEQQITAFLGQSTILGLSAHLENKKNFIKPTLSFTDDLLLEFTNSLKKELKKPIITYYTKDSSYIICLIKLNHKILYIKFKTKRFKSPTTYRFILWMIGTSILLVLISLIFMKNQMLSITKLALFTDKLGKGESMEGFKLSGAEEIRTVGLAFLRMKKRIERQIKYRTELLAHISHDLRTPLTRMKLKLALINESSMDIEFLNKNIDEMEEMLIQYLNFAKGEGNEPQKEVQFLSLIEQVLVNFYDPKIVFKPLCGNHLLKIKTQAFARCLSNIIDNAVKFSNEKVEVTAIESSEHFEIIVDDDGPGIPIELRKDVFKPFASYNKDKKGFGLGLTIAQTIMYAHGGKISLESNQYQGLRVVLKLPKP